MINCLDELFTSNDAMAECHWLLIKQFDYQTPFLFKEIKDLWVSDEVITVGKEIPHSRPFPPPPPPPPPTLNTLFNPYTRRLLHYI